MNTCGTIRRLWILGACLVLVFGCGGGGGGGGGGSNDGIGGNGGEKDPPAQPFSITSTGLHYRNFEDETNNVYRGLVGLASTSGPVRADDVLEAGLTDSAGTSIVPLDDGFYTRRHYLYDCRGGSCIDSGPTELTGLWATYDPLPADTYSVAVEMAGGQTLHASGEYPGRAAIPCIPAASMNSWRDIGDLVLKWAHPAEDLPGHEIDLIQIDIIADDGGTVLVVKLDAAAETTSIPGSLIDRVEEWAGSALARWQIQTRAHDDQGMNHARGYSSQVALNNAEAPFTIEYATIQHRTFPSMAGVFTSGFVGLADNGEAIAPEDVVSLRVTDSASNDEVVIAAEHYLDRSFVYDCTGAYCVQAGQANDSGILFKSTALPEDIYTVSLNMVNGQTLTVDVDYPGPQPVPVVQDNTMLADWESGNLVLQWSKPSQDDDWKLIDRIQVTVMDGSITVINVELNKDTERVIIPAALATDAMALGDGTLSYWQIQTRALDDRGMNYARGYSFITQLPPIPAP